MIGGSLALLFIGLMATGLLVFLSDFRTRKVDDRVWIPALLAGAYFYAGSGTVVQVYVLPFMGGALVVSTVVFLAFRSKGFGSADGIAIVAASLFPFLLLFAVVPAMVISYLGMKLHLWGGAGVPVAGLIGLMTVVVLATYILL